MYFFIRLMKQNIHLENKSILEMGGARRVVNLLSARDDLSCPAAISALELKCYYVSDTFRYSSFLLHRFYFLPTGFLLQM